MKKNMANADRVIRVIIAVILGALYLNGTISGILGIVLLVLSIVFVFTSLVSFCPIYGLLGISTLKKKIK
jgi:hypothetical protein